MKKKSSRILLAAVLFACILIATLALLVFNGIILINNPSEKDFPIRGVDVSHYQGEIDWQVLSAENIDFAYIKATEGASHTDKCFKYNFAEAQKTSLRVGAYHFFSFESSGKAQAEHFISTVPKTENMLPPVIDLEFYGDFAKEHHRTEEVKSELSVMINLLYSHYGVMPVIYTAEEEYELYVSGDFAETPIWMRSVYKKPSPLPDGRTITIWQYTNRERLNGYNGDEKFIDMNVFCGTEEEFYNFGK